MNAKSKAIYYLIIDYLTQMAEAHLISPAEQDAAQKLAAVQYGIEDVWQWGLDISPILWYML